MPFHQQVELQSSVDIPRSMIHAVRNASAKRVEAEKKKVNEEVVAENQAICIAEEISNILKPRKQEFCANI